MPTLLGSLIRPPPPLRLQVLRPHRCLRILVQCRLRAAFPAECSDEQPLLQLPTEYGLGPSGASRSPVWRVSTPPHAPRSRPPFAVAADPRRPPTSVPTVPMPSDRDRDELWEPLFCPSRSCLAPPPALPSPLLLRSTWAPSTPLLSCILAILLRVIHTPTGNESHRRSPSTMPPSDKFSSAGRWPCPPIFIVFTRFPPH